MAISQEALDIYNEAEEILDEAGDQISSRDLRDAISLLLLAVNKAGGVYPEAHGLVAELYRDLGDPESATRHADLALAQDPELLETRWLKVRLALEDPGSIDGGLVGALSGMSKKRKLNNEIERYMDLYDRLCQRGMEAWMFVYRSNSMIKLADELVQLRNPFGRKLYERVAKAPIANLTYEKEEERAEVKRVRHLAQGHVAF